MPKRCQKFQLNYIECRMNNGLMETGSMQSLGFNEVNSITNEREKKLEMFKRLVEVNKIAERNIMRMRGLDMNEFDNNLYHV
mmetsp:Transcript_12969/g.21936  ORF Transcript_12969/g.21936 Transcript_12969/m.21936 type:complete len:82 (-) Transcript_12969:34-279(-)